MLGIRRPNQHSLYRHATNSRHQHAWNVLSDRLLFRRAVAEIIREARTLMKILMQYRI